MQKGLSMVSIEDSLATASGQNLARPPKRFLGEPVLARAEYRAQSLFARVPAIGIFEGER